MGLESVGVYHPNMRDDGSSGSSEMMNGDSIGRLHPFNSRMTGENRKRRAAFIRFKISPPLVPLVLRPALRGGGGSVSELPFCATITPQAKSLSGGVRRC